MGRNQMMSERLKAAIEDEALEAFQYAPAEDKVQLGLDTIAMPCIDSNRDSSKLLADASDMISQLQDTVSDLTAKLNKKAGKKSS